MSAGWRRIAAALLAFASAMALNLQLERRERREALPRHSLYLPSGRSLRHASLGFRGLLADALYIWSIQYYSVDRGDRWRWLVQLYDVITDLDPRFEAAYLIGGVILSMEVGRPDQALALVDKGMRRLPGRYLLPWEAGFYARDLGHRERAAEYFLRASQCADAPAFVRRRYNAMLDELGRPRDALRSWRAILEAATSDYERQVAERHVHQLMLRIQLEEIRAAIAAFEQQAGRWPRNLEELVGAGLLAQAPLDPVGRPFRYDPSTGRVQPETGFLGKAPHEL